MMNAHILEAMAGSRPLAFAAARGARVVVKVALLACWLLGCSDPYLSNSRKSEDGANDGGNSASDNPDADGSVTPWQWAEAQALILAPWHHRLGDADLQGASIEAERVTFTEGRPAALEGLQVHDLLWYQSEQGSAGFLRRVEALGDEGGGWTVRTESAALDELFLKVDLEGEVAFEGDGALEGVPETFKHNWCRLQEDGPLAPCTAFPNLDEDGLYTTSEREPGSVADPRRVTFEFSPEVHSQPARLQANLKVDFFDEGQTQCACLTQHYGDAQALSAVCNLGGDVASAARRMGELKRDCHGRAQSLGIELAGAFGLFMNGLYAATDTPGTEVASSLPLSWGASAVRALDQGTLGLELEVTGEMQIQTDNSYELSWRSSDSPGVKWSGTWGMQWPDDAGNPTVRAWAEGLADEETQGIASPPIHAAQENGSFGVNLALVGRVVLLGVPVAQIHLVDQQVETSIRFTPTDAAGEGAARMSCPTQFQSRATSGLHFRGLSPLRTQSLEDVTQTLADSCAQGEGQPFADLFVCGNSVVDYCLAE